VHHIVRHKSILHTVPSQNEIRSVWRSKNFVKNLWKWESFSCRRLIKKNFLLTTGKEEHFDHFLPNIRTTGSIECTVMTDFKMYSLSIFFSCIRQWMWNSWKSNPQTLEPLQHYVTQQHLWIVKILKTDEYATYRVVRIWHCVEWSDSEWILVKDVEVGVILQRHTHFNHRLRIRFHKFLKILKIHEFFWILKFHRILKIKFVQLTLFTKSTLQA